MEQMELYQCGGWWVTEIKYTWRVKEDMERYGMEIGKWRLI